MAIGVWVKVKVTILALGTSTFFAHLLRGVTLGMSEIPTHGATISVYRDLQYPINYLFTFLTINSI